jgi:hypothetical protein
MRRIFSLPAVALILAATACGDGPTDPSVESVVGIYSLVTINGTAVPLTLVTEPDYRLEVLSGFFDLRADGTFTLSLRFRETVDGTATTSDYAESGTYTLSGSVLTFTTTEGLTGQATVSGNTLTIAESGLVLVFTR